MDGSASALSSSRRLVKPNPVAVSTFDITDRSGLAITMRPASKTCKTQSVDINAVHSECVCPTRTSEPIPIITGDAKGISTADGCCSVTPETSERSARRMFSGKITPVGRKGTDHHR